MSIPSKRPLFFDAPMFILSWPVHVMKAYGVT